MIILLHPKATWQSCHSAKGLSNQATRHMDEEEFQTGTVFYIAGKH